MRYDNKYYCSSCKLPFVPVRFYWNLSFLDRFSKTPQISNLMKICLVGAELFQWDRWIDAAFLKLWSADHKWSSGSALVVLLD